MPLWESGEDLDAVAKKRLGRLSMNGITSIGFGSPQEAEKVEAAIKRAADELRIGVVMTRATRDLTRGSGEPTGYVKAERVARGGSRRTA